VTNTERDNTIDDLEWATSHIRHGKDQEAIAYLQDAAERMGFTLRPINDATAQARLAEVFDGMAQP